MGSKWKSEGFSPSLGNFDFATRWQEKQKTVRRKRKLLQQVPQRYEELC